LTRFSLCEIARNLTPGPIQVSGRIVRSSDSESCAQDHVQQSGEYTGSSKQFREAIQRHGLRPSKSRDGNQRGYYGLRLTK
jgi:hypothetical protein